MPDFKSNDLADKSVTALAVDDTTDDTKSITDSSDTDEGETEAQPG